MNNFTKTNDGIWVPIDKRSGVDFSDGVESESYLFEVLRKVKDRSSTSDELKTYIKDWPTRYHFSKERANILRALDYVLPRKSKVLEVGAGCGAVSRYLAETFASVDAVEGSYARSKIAKERTRDLSNANIICANFKDALLDGYYDLACLVGVLEYAQLFWNKNENAYLSFLKRISSLLNNDGFLVLAIENRLGLKYWTGCTDDHTRTLYDGTLGYPSKEDQVCTFSKQEITGLLVQAGFNEVLFLYPFPDYKIPNLILSQKCVDEAQRLNAANFFLDPFEDYSSRRVYALNELLLVESIISASLLDEFSNSFLIVARKEGSIQEVPFLFKKYNLRRVNKYATITTAAENSSDEITVKKDQFVSDIQNGDQEIEHRFNAIPYYDAELLIRRVFKESYKGNFREVFKTYLKEIYTELMNRFLSAGHDESGYPLVKGEAVDFTFWNLMKHENEYVCIDDEWKFKDILPIDYVLFRNFLYLGPILLFSKDKETYSDDSIVDIMRSVLPQYTVERLHQNMDLESAFQSKVLGLDIDIRHFFASLYDQASISMVGFASSMKDLDREMNRCREQLFQKDCQIEHMQNTLSWKITAPLRWLGKILHFSSTKTAKK